MKLSLVNIESNDFKHHITDKHPEYSDLLTFVLPPVVRIGHKRLKEKTYLFDISESTSMNSGGKIVNVQWDFDYGKRFSSTQGYSFLRGKKNESLLQAEYAFPHTAKYTIACRVQDDLGGEATKVLEIEVS